LFMLLLEGKAWMDHPGIQYVVLLKIYPATASSPLKLRLIVLEKGIFPGESTLANPSPGSMCSFPHRNVTNFGTAALASMLNVKIIFDRTILRGDLLTDLICSFDPSRLYEG